MTDATQDVLDRHLEAAAVRDVDQIMAEYTRASVLMTPDGTFRGPEEIRGFFVALFDGLPTDLRVPETILHREVVDGVAFLVWQTLPAFPFCVDTLVVDDAAIRYQTFAAHLAE